MINKYNNESNPMNLYILHSLKLERERKREIERERLRWYRTQIYSGKTTDLAQKFTLVDITLHDHLTNLIAVSFSLSVWAF